MYFVAADREPVPSHAPKIRQIMSLVAEVLHDELRAKGHRPRRLEFESADGEAVVHLVRGTQPAAYYHANWDTDPQAQMTRIHDELLKSFGDPDRHLTVVFSETYEPGPAKEAWAGHIARGVAKPPEGGLAVYSSWILKDEFSSANRDAQLKLFFDQTPIQGRKAFGSRLANSPRYEFVEDAFGETAEEARHAAFQHLAARRKQSRFWRDHVAQADQVVFVAAGAVQQQERRRVAVRTGFVSVDERELGGGHDGPRCWCKAPPAVIGGRSIVRQTSSGSTCSMSRRRLS